MSKDIEFKVEKDRVLFPIGQPCPFGCRYCYTRSGEVGPPRIDTEQLLQRFYDFVEHSSFRTIQFGYDGDPFADPERGIFLLKRLSTLDKHVNFSTKASIEGSLLQAIEDICINMTARKQILSALISLSCWNSAPRIEPYTPTVEQRITSVKNLKHIQVPTFISIRPILPNIPDEEYKQLIDAGCDAQCDGFILGPLYEDEKKRFTRFIAPELLASIPSTEEKVAWSPHSPHWKRYEDPERLACLKAMIEEKQGIVFFSSADAVQSLYCKEEAPV